MGDGEFSGNGSVYWSIDHEDGADLKVKTNDSNRPPKNGTTNVHVKTKANGRDPIPVADVGKKKGHTGKFRVTLRFESKTAAQDAAEEQRLVDTTTTCGRWCSTCRSSRAESRRRPRERNSRRLVTGRVRTRASSD